MMAKTHGVRFMNDRRHNEGNQLSVDTAKPEGKQHQMQLSQ